MFAPMDDDNLDCSSHLPPQPRSSVVVLLGYDSYEALLFKFHDSDRSVGWRTPHTAFWDDSFLGRTCARDRVPHHLFLRVELLVFCSSMVSSSDICC